MSGSSGTATGSIPGSTVSSERPCTPRPSLHASLCPWRPLTSPRASPLSPRRPSLLQASPRLRPFRTEPAHCAANRSPPPDRFVTLLHRELVLAALFAAMDADGDAYLSAAEIATYLAANPQLRAVLGSVMGGAGLGDMLVQLAASGDADVSFSLLYSCGEFCAQFNAAPPSEGPVGAPRSPEDPHDAIAAERQRQLEHLREHSRRQQEELLSKSRASRVLATHFRGRSVRARSRVTERTVQRRDDAAVVIQKVGRYGPARDDLCASISGPAVLVTRLVACARAPSRAEGPLSTPGARCRAHLNNSFDNTHVARPVPASCLALLPGAPSPGPAPDSAVTLWGRSAGASRLGALSLNMATRPWRSRRDRGGSRPAAPSTTTAGAPPRCRSSPRSGGGRAARTSAARELLPRGSKRRSAGALHHAGTRPSALRRGPSKRIGGDS